MTTELSEAGIITELAEDAAERIARKTIAALQRLTDTMSGEDSGLATVWDEVCVQIQHEQSFFWDIYDQTVSSTADHFIQELRRHELEALWLQTEQGDSWTYEEPDEREPNAVDQDDVTSHIVQSYVYSKAADWSNARIRRYLDRTYDED